MESAYIETPPKIIEEITEYWQSRIAEPFEITIIGSDEFSGDAITEYILDSGGVERHCNYTWECA